MARVKNRKSKHTFISLKKDYEYAPYFPLLTFSLLVCLVALLTKKKDERMISELQQSDRCCIDISQKLIPHKILFLMQVISQRNPHWMLPEACWCIYVNVTCMWRKGQNCITGNHTGISCVLLKCFALSILMDCECVCVWVWVCVSV